MHENVRAVYRADKGRVTKYTGIIEAVAFDNARLPDPKGYPKGKPGTYVYTVQYTDGSRDREECVLQRYIMPSAPSRVLDTTPPLN